MSAKNNPTLQIDTEFESKIPPLTDEEYRQLEENIVSEGAVLMPLIVWNGTIVDGHNRYRIAQTHADILFSVYEKGFTNRYEALAWICKNQLGRRNLTPVQKKMLIGDRYEAEKMAHGGDRKSGEAKSRDKNCPLIPDHKSRKQVAQDAGVTEAFVRCASQYSRGATAAEEVAPGFRQEVLTGKVKPTQKEMWAIAKASPAERKRLIQALKGAAGDSEDDEHRMTAQDAIQQFEWKVTRTLQAFDHTFGEWPQLISNESYRQQVILTLYDLKQYILHIEGGIQYEWNKDARKIV